MRRDTPLLLGLVVLLGILAQCALLALGQTLPPTESPNATTFSTTLYPSLSPTGTATVPTTTAPARNSSTNATSPAEAPPPHDVTAIQFALLGAAVGLVGCAACVAVACWMHRTRYVPGAGAMPSAQHQDAESAHARDRQAARRHDAAMSFGAGMRVRGATLAKLKDHWDAKRREAAAEPVDEEAEALVQYHHTHYQHPYAAAAGQPSVTPGGRNPIDRFAAGDAVASYRTGAGADRPHTGPLPWDGATRIGADGVPIVVVEAADTGDDAASAWPTEAPTASMQGGNQRLGAPANTTFSRPVTRTPSAAADAPDSPSAFVVTPPNTPPPVYRDDGVFVRVRRFFNKEPELDAARDPRVPRPDEAAVFAGLAARDVARQQQQRGRGSSGRLQQAVDDHELVEEAVAEMRPSSELCHAWLDAIDPAPVDPQEAMRNVQAWCLDLPPEPAGEEGRRAFAKDRTEQWVLRHRPGPLELPPAPPRTHTHPHANGAGATAMTPPATASSPSYGLYPAGFTPPTVSPASARHVPIALRLTADSLKLPPKRDALGREI